MRPESWSGKLYMRTGWRKLHEEEFLICTSRQNKSRNARWAKHAVWMVEMRNVYRIAVVKFDSRTTSIENLGTGERITLRWIFLDIVYEDRIHLDHWWAVGHTEFTLWGIKRDRKFLPWMINYQFLKKRSFPWTVYVSLHCTRRRNVC